MTPTDHPRGEKLKSKTVTAALIAAAFMVVSASALIADGSDAYTATNGESGIGYSISLSGEDIAKLIPADDIEDMAIDHVLETITPNTYYFDLNGTASVSNYEAAEYWGMKVYDTGDSSKGVVVTDVSSQTTSYDISFTATCTDTGNELFRDNLLFIDVIRAIGPENETQSGAKFIITAHVERTDVTISESSYAPNSSAVFVLFAGNEKGYTMYEVAADVKYVYSASDGERTLEFSLDVKEENGGEMTTAYDFNGVAISDVTMGTHCIRDRHYVDGGVTERAEVKIGGSTQKMDLGYDATFMDMMAFASSDHLSYAETADGNLVVPEYSFYGTDWTTCLFESSDVASSDLKSNDAMRQFLSDHGSVVTTFSEAESAADDAYSTVDVSSKKDSNIVYYAAIGGLAALAAVLAIVYLRKAGTLGVKQ